MNRHRLLLLGLSLGVSLGLAVALAPPPLAAQHDHAAPAAVSDISAFPDSALARLKALAGEWIDLDGSTGHRGEVVVTYRVTGGGSAIVETLFPGTPHEMTTVYHRDGADLLLTHYCAAGNQPRMRARKLDGNVLAFEFDGGSNLDPAKDMHMHSGRIELLGPDRVNAEWQGWESGAPNGAHLAKFHLARRKG